jgi:TRAP-type C4-dicarboxylate transport system permease small subunit
MADHRPGEEESPFLRAVSAILLTLLVGLFGAMGTCGVSYTVSAINGRTGFLGLALPAAIVGVVGAAWCVRTLFRQYRR